MIPVLTQLQYFFWTVTVGFAIAFSFDFYRALRVFLKPPRWAVHLCDLFFWILATIVGYLMLLGINWGEVRLYVLIGIGIGAYIYYGLTSKYFFNFWLYLFNLTRRLLKVFRRLVKLPFRLLKKIFRIPLGLITYSLYKCSGIFQVLRGLSKICKQRCKNALGRLRKPRT